MYMRVRVCGEGCGKSIERSGEMLLASRTINCTEARDNVDALLLELVVVLGLEVGRHVDLLASGTERLQEH